MGTQGYAAPEYIMTGILCTTIQKLTKFLAWIDIQKVKGKEYYFIPYS